MSESVSVDSSFSFDFQRNIWDFLVKSIKPIFSEENYSFCRSGSAFKSLIDDFASEIKFDKKSPVSYKEKNLSITCPAYVIKRSTDIIESSLNFVSTRNNYNPFNSNRFIDNYADSMGNNMSKSPPQHSSSNNRLNDTIHRGNQSRHSEMRGDEGNLYGNELEDNDNFNSRNSSSYRDRPSSRRKQNHKKHQKSLNDMSRLSSKSKNNRSYLDDQRTINSDDNDDDDYTSSDNSSEYEHRNHRRNSSPPNRFNSNRNRKMSNRNRYYHEDEQGNISFSSEDEDQKLKNALFVKKHNKHSNHDLFDDVSCRSRHNNRRKSYVRQQSNRKNYNNNSSGMRISDHYQNNQSVLGNNNHRHHYNSHSQLPQYGNSFASTQRHHNINSQLSNHKVLPYASLSSHSNMNMGFNSISPPDLASQQQQQHQYMMNEESYYDNNNTPNTKNRLNMFNNSSMVNQPLPNNLNPNNIKMTMSSVSSRNFQSNGLHNHFPHQINSDNRSGILIPSNSPSQSIQIMNSINDRHHINSAYSNRLINHDNIANFSGHNTFQRLESPVNYNSSIGAQISPPIFEQQQQQFHNPMPSSSETPLQLRNEGKQSMSLPPPPSLTSSSVIMNTYFNNSNMYPYSHAASRVSPPPPLAAHDRAPPPPHLSTEQKLLSLALEADAFSGMMDDAPAANPCDLSRLSAYPRDMTGRVVLPDFGSSNLTTPTNNNVQLRGKSHNVEGTIAALMNATSTKLHHQSLRSDFIQNNPIGMNTHQRLQQQQQQQQHTTLLAHSGLTTSTTASSSRTPSAPPIDLNSNHKSMERKKTPIKLSGVIHGPPKNINNNAGMNKDSLSSIILMPNGVLKGATLKPIGESQKDNL